jgi:hypothetical protein
MQAFRRRQHSAHAPRELAEFVHSRVGSYSHVWMQHMLDMSGTPNKISSNELPECRFPAP